MSSLVAKTHDNPLNITSELPKIIFFINIVRLRHKECLL